ncbi:MAG: thioredoxin family protein [Gemmatimonadaceae bacterium]|nr:thioredoxin family protein [Gemmatimonadaceae bacterium]
MARTESTMLALGTLAPDFALPDVAHGRVVTRDDVRGDVRDGKPLLVMFISRHCPYVIHVAQEIARVGHDYAGRVAMVAIAANDIAGYPDDAPSSMQAMARDYGFTFPVLYDESQEIAKAYAAACTPDFFLFDQSARLAYRGQLDDARPRNDRPITGRDLRAALDAVLAHQSPSPEQFPSLGCNIKWRPGHEPAYFSTSPR